MDGDGKRKADGAAETEAEAKRRKRIEAWKAQKLKLASAKGSADGEAKQQQHQQYQQHQQQHQQHQQKASPSQAKPAPIKFGAPAFAFGGAGAAAGGGGGGAGAAGGGSGGGSGAGACRPASLFAEEAPKQRLPPGFADDDGGGAPAPAPGAGAEAAQQQPAADDEVDPLDAFMAAEVMPEVQRLEDREKEGAPPNGASGTGGGKGGGGASGAGGRELPLSRFGDGADSDSEDEEAARRAAKEETDAEWAKRLTTQRSKSDRMARVDHAAVAYEPIRKDLYIEAPELKRMGAEARAALKEELEIRVRGKGAPCPIRSWYQCGLSDRILGVLKKLAFEKPTAIQAQALPAIMSGRDCIGIAKTGSGKTLAFVLPMLRHVMDQRPLAQGEGMVGLVMAPTRELTRQIYEDTRRFARAVNLRVVAAYGGSPIGAQISAMKAGCEIVVATPGRFIDILTAGGGKVTNLGRVSFLVLDEADRCFDMGFAPQITKIIQNTRPDRQTVMFSATFPRQVELLAKEALSSPLEILVGGRSVVNRDIDQHVEVRPEEDRFLRTLELLGEWFELGKVIIFVHSQDRCAKLFQDLLRAGYPCLSLHGGQEQADRDTTIADFKSDVCNMIVATSVCARGLDVPGCRLVINYDTPSHMEDYVHRVGRTGRAGNKGTAYTFIGTDESHYANDIIKALEQSGQHIPLGIRALNYQQKQRLLLGTASTAGSGFGGKGFRFDKEEADKGSKKRKAQAKQFGDGAGDGADSDSSDSEDDGVVKTAEEAARDRAKQHAQMLIAKAEANSKAAKEKGVLKPIAAGLGVRDAVAAPSSSTAGGSGTGDAPGVTAAQRAAAQAAAKAAAEAMAKQQLVVAGTQNAIVLKASETAKSLSLRLGGAVGPQNHAAPPSLRGHFQSEIEVNDFSQPARYAVTNKQAFMEMERNHEVSLTPKGVYVKPGLKVPPGERKLYILIEGKSEMSVRRCRSDIKRRIEEEVAKQSLPGHAVGGRYQV